MDVYADDLAALLDVLKLDRAVIAGLSMGGYVAMAFARRHARRIAALILADTRAGADTPEAGAGRRQTADRVLREGVGVVAATMIEKLIAAATRSQRPALADDLNAIMLSNTPQGVAAALHALADRPDSLASLAAITAPTLVIVGEQDVLTPPAESEKIAAAVRGARLARIADAGHAPNLEQPAAFNDAVRSFLATLPGT
jgi:pimeloyl-ACP methyl ester carboxylesterase